MDLQNFSLLPSHWSFFCVCGFWPLVNICKNSGKVMSKKKDKNRRKREKLVFLFLFLVFLPFFPFLLFSSLFFSSLSSLSSLFFFSLFFSFLLFFYSSIVSFFFLFLFSRFIKWFFKFYFQVLALFSDNFDIQVCGIVGFPRRTKNYLISIHAQEEKWIPSEYFKIEMEIVTNNKLVFLTLGYYEERRNPCKICYLFFLLFPRFFFIFLLNSLFHLSRQYLENLLKRKGSKNKLKIRKYLMIKNEIFYNVSFLGHGHNDRGDPGERTCRLFNLRTRHTIRNKIFKQLWTKQPTEDSCIKIGIRLGRIWKKINFLTQL